MLYQNSKTSIVSEFGGKFIKQLPDLKNGDYKM